MNTPIEHTAKSAKSAKRYTAAFKQEALALIAAGRSMSQVARDLGVSIWTLGEWKKQASSLAASPVAEDPSVADPSALAAEIARLRKALAKSELHADILKKALAIVGQQPPDSSR
jgi:transposase-like protein